MLIRIFCPNHSVVSRFTSLHSHCICVMQGAFVLCRLFKKHDLRLDENAENSNCDDVEPNLSPPTVVKSPAEDEHFETLTPSFGGQAEMPPLSKEGSPANLGDGAAVVEPLPINWHNSGCNDCKTEDQVLESISFPVSRTIDPSGKKKK